MCSGVFFKLGGVALGWIIQRWDSSGVGWRFENGGLVITLAESGDELRFSEVQEE